MWGTLLWGVTCCGLGGHHCAMLQVVTGTLEILATSSSQNHLACQYCHERERLKCLKAQSFVVVAYALLHTYLRCNN